MPSPKRLLLSTKLSPGDTVMLTAAVRDLHRAHPKKFLTDVDTVCMPIWENNPHITKLKWHYGDVETDNGPRRQLILDDPTIEPIECHYPLVHRSNKQAYHFVHGYTDFLEERLGIRIPVTDMCGDIHIGKSEKGWMNQVQQHYGHKGPFWIIVAGGKYDYTTKWWDPHRYQQVVDHFKGKIQFVQCGEEHHWHRPLRGVINLLGRTDPRQFIRLVYHSAGVVCPVTFAMHLAAAVPTMPGRPANRACVVVAGGREPAQWEAYPHHRYLSTNGALLCCDNGGCWKARCMQVGDGDQKDNPQDLCPKPVPVPDEDLVIPRCMDMIKAADVVRAIEMYYEGGALEYQT